MPRWTPPPAGEVPDPRIWGAPDGVELQCIVDRAAVRVSPGHDAQACSELVLGERFIGEAAANGWINGRCGHDHYVGYVEADALAGAGPPPTHRVSARSALLFASASIKAAVVGRPPPGAVIRASGAEGAFLQSERGFIHTRHVRAIGDWEVEAVTVAERLMGAPYLWGGRSDTGIDCSGLVQVALAACGIACPRDSDMQRVLGIEADPSRPSRGDLVFFPGHVGLMTDAATLLHANAHWMAVVAEPLADVVARLEAAGHARPVRAIRRIA